MDVAGDLTDLLVPIDSVRPLERNARRGNVSAIAESLSRWGQVKPIVVSADGQILAGNHTHAAAVTLGWAEIAAVRLPVHSEDVEAVALAIADNRTSDLSRWENELLADLLTEVAGTDAELLVATGFTAEQVEELVSFTAGPAAAGSDGDGEDGEGGGATCPTCQRPL